MPDEAATVETLDDDSTEWLAVLRGLPRRADGSTDHETLADEPGADAGGRRFAFLELVRVQSALRLSSASSTQTIPDWCRLSD